jgi:hypothetical protein
MCVSQTGLTPLPISPPQFPVNYQNPHRHKTSVDDGSKRRYRVVRYVSAIESDYEFDESGEVTKETKVPVLLVRVFFDGKGAHALKDFLDHYPNIDAWRPGSMFVVVINTGGAWKKIYSPPY